MSLLSRAGSFRQRTRPMVRPSFRDDTSLVAIRYEKMAQGDAPTPIQTVNPVRASSRPVSVRTSSTQSQSQPPSTTCSASSPATPRRSRSPSVTSCASSSRSTSCPPSPSARSVSTTATVSTPASSPLVPSSPIAHLLLPSPGSPIAVRPPPPEEHPALRQDNTKRDSGHAQRTTPTINEEDECDDDDDYQYYCNMSMFQQGRSASAASSSTTDDGAQSDDAASTQKAPSTCSSVSSSYSQEQQHPQKDLSRRRSTSAVPSLPASSPRNNHFPSRTLSLRTSASSPNVAARRRTHLDLPAVDAAATTTLSLPPRRGPRPESAPPADAAAPIERAAGSEGVIDPRGESEDAGAGAEAGADAAVIKTDAAADTAADVVRVTVPEAPQDAGPAPETWSGDSCTSHSTSHVTSTTATATSHIPGTDTDTSMPKTKATSPIPRGTTTTADTDHAACTASQGSSPPPSPLWKRGVSILRRNNSTTTATTASSAPSTSAPGTSSSAATTTATTSSFHCDADSTATDRADTTQTAAPSHPSPPNTATTASYTPLDIAIPTQSLAEDDFIAGLEFSHRGSVILDAMPGADADADADATTTTTTSSTPTRQPTPNNNMDSSNMDSQSMAESTSTTAPGPTTSTATSPTPPLPDIRVMAADADRESQKVRSLYAVGGSAMRWEDGAAAPSSAMGDRAESPIVEHPEEDDAVPSATHLSPAANISSTSFDSSSPRPRPSSADGRPSTVAGGGLEDWDDLDGLTVDRYGFITAPPPRPASARTELKSSQYSPRRRNNLLRKRSLAGSTLSVATAAVDGDGNRIPTRKMSTRSLHTQNSAMSTTASVRSSRSVIRQASNLLPHNRHRRWMDEAGDMLTVAPSMQDVAEEARVERISEALKRKEWERSEKWRKMAVVTGGSAGGSSKDNKHVNPDQPRVGGGMHFEFDVKNPKLIERTWKGVPDCWRSAAWWSFLEASARAAPPENPSPSAEALTAAFHQLQARASPDDVQIDLDVPRTISRHIMFRRRYAGGQRLLFRVLHALSIHFPATGYVQGMASLAATLLCYFDEERTFVMLVRMWTLRGLARLFAPGFEGLMTGLDELESDWLDGDVRAHLEDLGIDKTAYGTRWYLTLFNLSIPFAAQLRVWDVFLLLGGNPPRPQHNTWSLSSSRTLKASSSSRNLRSAAGRPKTADPKAASAPVKQPTGLDVLHATSAALIQALREVLLDADFENAMKALTAFTPIKDEDLLMKVARAEWKRHHK